MINNIWLVIFILFLSVSYSQEVTVTGIVTDEEGQSIPDARCSLNGIPNNKWRTDKSGNFSIRHQFKDGDTITFNHVAFEKNSIVITRKLLRKASNGMIKIDLVLPYRMLEVLDVIANVPDTVFGTQDYSVADFEFNNQNNLILLTYEKTLKKGGVLRLLDQKNEVVDIRYVRGNATELKKDFRGNVHLICEEEVYLIQTRDEHLELFLEDRDYFFKYVLPVIDTIGENIYFSNYSELYPAFDYMEFDRIDSSYNPMLTVQDDLMMELYRSEYKYVDVRTKLWAHNKQIETGIDKEVWVGATVFTNSLYYESLYAPLFKYGHDSLFVFDHYKDYLFKYTPDEGFVDSVRIAYHKTARKSGWEQPLLQDATRDLIYGLFLLNGFTYLSQINPQSGGVEQRFKLHFKYVENIQIVDGYVYYIYRPFESIQKKYIYRERLTV